MKDLIYQVKLGRDRLLARQLGQYMAELLPYLSDDVLVCPVPTAATRVRRRGFDQAELLARAVARVKSLPYRPCLVRQGNFDQIGKRRSERFKQMQSSFAVRPGVDLAGRTFLLVDDVLTTGATLEAAATTLRASGTRHVDTLVVARHLLA